LRSEKQRLREEWAAVLVQLAWRRKRAQQKLMKLRREKQSLMECRVAVKLQSVWRSKLARRRSMRLRCEIARERERAATRMASSYRGFRERCKIVKKAVEAEDLCLQLSKLSSANKILRQQISSHDNALSRETRRVQELEGQICLLQTAEESARAELVTLQMSSDARVRALEEELFTVRESLSAASSELSATIVAQSLAQSKLEEALRKEEEEKAAHAAVVLNHMAAEAAARKLEEEMVRLREELTATVQREQVSCVSYWYMGKTVGMVCFVELNVCYPEVFSFLCCCVDLLTRNHSLFSC